MFLPATFAFPQRLPLRLAVQFLMAFLLCLTFVPASIANGVDRYGEREVLARVIAELNHIDTMLEEAEAKADPDARIRLQYAPLRRDLMTIRHGIDTHLMTPDQQPRSFKPLSGDYRR